MAGATRRSRSWFSVAPGAGSGVEVKIDPGFLSPGRYMIELGSRPPLKIPRFVLEVR